jgi:hypothetical protein
MPAVAKAGPPAALGPVPSSWCGTLWA